MNYNTTSTNTLRAPSYVDNGSGTKNLGLQVEELPKTQQQISLEELSKLVQQNTQQPFIFPQTPDINLFPGPWTFAQGTQPETSKRTLHTNGHSVTGTVVEPMEQPGTKKAKESDVELRRELDELRKQNAELLQFLKSQSVVNTPPSSSTSQKQEQSHPQTQPPSQPSQHILPLSQSQPQLPQPLQPVPLPQGLAFAIGKAQQQLAIFQSNQDICSTPGCTHPAKKQGKCGTCINNEDRKALKVHTQELQKQKYQEKHVAKIARFQAEIHVKKLKQQESMHQTMQKVIQAAKFTQETQQLYQEMEAANQQQYEAALSFFGYKQNFS